jgi:sterol desaturase/sphingolipid hydroxylase (fatty acid hydroxylase superfamily)
VLIAFVERAQPYEAVWDTDHDDTAVDILHAAFSLTLIFTLVEISTPSRIMLPEQLLGIGSIWPTASPLWIKVLFAGAILDFGLWFMHWLSHKNDFLWRLHTLHHSSERLYWLNGERRHPISALLLASQGLVVARVLGSPAAVIGCWFAIIAVHLAFQYSNLNYSVGVFRAILGVTEIHRWHHKREYQDAQVNFGEFWMIWDQLFGTFKYHSIGVRAGDVGMHEAMLKSYMKQLQWPFNKTN